MKSKEGETEEGGEEEEGRKRGGGGREKEMKGGKGIDPQG